MWPAAPKVRSAGTDIAGIAKYFFAIRTCKIRISCTVHLPPVQWCFTRYFFVCILSDFSSGLLSRISHLILDFIISSTKQRRHFSALLTLHFLERGKSGSSVISTGCILINQIHLYHELMYWYL